MGWKALVCAVMVVVGGGRSGGVLGPVTVVAPQDGPRVVYRPMEPPPLIAVRLSVPVEERPGLRGAARVLQEVWRERLTAEAAKVGARLRLTRSPGHAVYSLVGPRESFDAMVALLRRAVSKPSGTREAIEAARIRVEREAMAALEIPGARVRVGLEAGLFGAGDGEAGGVLPDVVDAEALEWFWRRYYVPERMSVVVVGAVPLEDAVRAFRDWPSPDPPADTLRSLPAVSAREVPRPEAVAAWTGIGWTAMDVEPAVLAVASRIVHERLAATELRHAKVEMWWSIDGLGLIAIGSVLPQDGRAESGVLETRLRAAIAEAANSVTPEAAADTRRAIANGLLLDARTPAGLAELLGQFLDRTGDAEAAPRFIAALARVEATQVRAALSRLMDHTPVREEIVP